MADTHDKTDTCDCPDRISIGLNNPSVKDTPTKLLVPMVSVLEVFHCTLYSRDIITNILSLGEHYFHVVTVNLAGGEMIHVHIQGCDLSGGYFFAKVEQNCIKCSISALFILR